MFSRQLAGVFSKPIISGVRTTSHRLYSSAPKPSPRPSPRPPAPQSRSNFPVIPIIALFAISSGAYVFLVKSRTGQSPGRKDF
ncbi:uncharacterized protein N7511_008934 [Penicillium nucicola]|uniref:uncharacterized protein n=1 Tax=Penicillium nucicola TaxID=1850975 RepID=UPI00254500D9|nr:uncharacterized protein N7511_008934 [Penicillium nucicola]KAJ5747238.1 hypothetical protein N7511_008934 [Penicillium nucicola]